jgi:hypothetical protein
MTGGNFAFIVLGRFVGGASSLGSCSTAKSQQPPTHERRPRSRQYIQWGLTMHSLHSRELAQPNCTSCTLGSGHQNAQNDVSRRVTIMKMRSSLIMTFSNSRVSTTLFTCTTWSSLCSWSSGKVREQRAFQSDMQEPSVTCTTQASFVVMNLSTSPTSVVSLFFNTSTWKYLYRGGVSV